MQVAWYSRLVGRCARVKQSAMRTVFSHAFWASIDTLLFLLENGAALLPRRVTEHRESGMKGNKNVFALYLSDSVSRTQTRLDYSEHEGGRGKPSLR